MFALFRFSRGVPTVNRAAKVSLTNRHLFNSDIESPRPTSVRELSTLSSRRKRRPIDEFPTGARESTPSQSFVSSLRGPPRPDSRAPKHTRRLLFYKLATPLASTHACGTQTQSVPRASEQQRRRPPKRSTPAPCINLRQRRRAEVSWSRHPTAVGDRFWPAAARRPELRLSGDSPPSGESSSTWDIEDRPGNPPKMDPGTYSEDRTEKTGLRRPDSEDGLRRPVAVPKKNHDERQLISTC